MAKTLNKVDVATGTCGGCGAGLGSDARFCAECGQQVAVAPPNHVVVEIPLPRSVSRPTPWEAGPVMPVLASDERVVAKPKRSALRVVAMLALGMTLLAGLAVLSLNDRGTHTRLASSRQAYRTSQVQLKDTQAKLTQTVSELTGTKTDLASTKATLTTVKTELAAKEQDLQGVRNNLADVKSSVTIQAGQIETLKSCLSGVSIALSDLASGDYSGTIAALEAVQVSCNSAYALL
jgi:hypothetical protein